MQIRTEIIAVIMLICWVVGINAQTPSGLTCEDAIPLGEEYIGSVPSAGVYWYKASTYDLPLRIHFRPSATASDIAPAVQVNFTCTPGVYDDPKLDSIINMADGWGYAMPLTFICNLVVVDGHNEYDMAVGKTYRDLLASLGYTDNVTAYVRVEYGGAGDIGLAPDTAFSSCMDRGKLVSLGSTLSILPNDPDTFFIFPMTKWQNDSVRMIWSGTESASVYLSTICDFEPNPFDDANKIYDVYSIAPNGTFKLSDEDIRTALDWPENNGGLFYAKVISNAEGTLKIDKIPVTPPKGDATLLQYDTKEIINRHDTAKLYAIPRGWVKATMFTTPTDYSFRMYVGATPDFYTTGAFATYQFDKTKEGHQLTLLDKDMENLWENKSSNDNYLYIRFDCGDRTSILPTLWTPSDCMIKANRIRPGEEVEVTARSSANYGLYYEDWRGGDMTLSWTHKTTQCPFYIGDTCTVPASTDAPTFYSDKVPRNSSTVCVQSVVDSWEEHVDPDGYVYIRFYPLAKGKITITTVAPSEVDPTCTTYDSILTVTAWDSCVWRGKTYTESGDYSESGPINPATECADTLYVLQLTIHTTTYYEVSLQGCDSIIYKGKIYSISGEYADTVYTAAGNRIITLLNLTVSQSFHKDSTVVACGGIEWEGQWYDKTGDYTFTTTNAEGCDSIVTLHLTVNYPTTGELTLTECDSLFWNGEWRKSSGDYEYHTTNAAGCDSTAILHLTIHPSYAIVLPDASVCETQEYDGYVWGDTVIHDSGTYTRRFKSRYGCDSVVTQKVTILQPSYNQNPVDVTAYDRYTTNMGITYKKSVRGAIDVYENAAGCDSIITLNLTIRHLQVRDTFVRTLCATELPYEWFGKSYMESGIYSSDTIKGKEVNGVYMDTVHAVDLTVIPVSTGDTTAVACESFTWYGTTYKESAEPKHTFVGANSHGCDSIVTLHLTIHHATSGDTTATACESFTWYGTTYKESAEPKHTFVGANSHGCDSIVTLHLTIHHATSGEITKSACESYEWNGTIYTENGDYTYETKNSHGCDSTATLHLTIYHATSGEESRTEYDSYTWYGTTYTQSGDYTYETKNSHGCDSTATLHLTIIERPFEDYTFDTVYFCTGFNKEHEERVTDVLIRRYLPYVYQSPSEWDYMEGVMLDTEHDRTLMDLSRAESNLRNHYVGELTPIERIVWSVRHDNSNAYMPIEAGDQPQWINAGKLAVQILFRCGEMYNNAYPMDVEMVNGEKTNGRKVLRNGQIIIIRNGQEYNLLGSKIQ